MVRSTDGDGRTTTYTWSNGLLVTVTTPNPIANGPSTVTTHNYYNMYRQLIRSSDDLGIPTTYTYDAAGNLVETSVASSPAPVSVYNGDNEVVQTTNPDTGQTSQVYDAYGLVVSRTDEMGNTTTDAYDTPRPPRLGANADRHDHGRL